MKKLDVIILMSWVVIPPVLLFVIHGNFFISSILYLVLPSIYFSARKPEIIIKSLIVSLVAMPLMIIFDYLAFLNKTWEVPTIFPLRFFQFIPIEDFFFTFCAVYVVIVASNYFFPGLNLKMISRPTVRRSLFIVSVLFVIFIILYTFKLDILIIHYYYAWLILFAFIIPSLILFIRFKSYRKPFFWITVYSICLMLPYEVTAGKLGFWTFPSGEYMGMVHVFGWGFPIEEFLAWMIFFPLSTLAFGKWVVGGENEGT